MDFRSGVVQQGKPRPALVVQADHFGDLASVTVLPITSTLIDAPLLRVPVEPSRQNGLARRSQIMVDKPQTPGRSKLGAVIGRLDDATMVTLNRVLAVFLAAPPPAAGAFSRRPRQVAGGTARSCTACSTTCARATNWSSGSLIACRAR